MKRSRGIAALAASVMAAAGIVIGAGTASAATPWIFCVVGHGVCAVPSGANPVSMEGNGPTYYWLYNGYNHPGQIQLDNSGQCMQLDQAGGYTVIMAACNGASYQKWNGFDIGGGNEGFQSEYDSSRCLTYNAMHHDLDAVQCTANAWYQTFYVAP